MSAVFLPPLAGDYEVHSSNAAATAPASRVLLDEPGLVARSGGNSLSLTFSLTERTFDSIAATGTNLRASDTVRVRVGSVADMSSDVLLDYSVNAWNGVAPVGSAITYIPLDRPYTAQFVRLDFTTSNTFVEVSRVLIGKRIEVDGIDNDPSITHVGGATVEDGPGWTTVGEARTRVQWTANVGNVPSTAYYQEWSPFLSRAGKHAGFLFVPQTDSTALQHEAKLVRHQQDANTVPLSMTRYRVEMKLLEV